MELLPYGTAYAAAIEQDDELAELVNDGATVDQQRPKKLRPSSRAWNHVRGDLADVKDLLQVIAHVAAHSDEPLKPTPRPETAHERWERNKRHENTDWLMQQLGLDHD